MTEAELEQFLIESVYSGKRSAARELKTEINKLLSGLAQERWWRGMSRHGYSDDIDQWQLIKWRGQVASAMRGKRGQQLLIDLVKALDAMPEKVLIARELIDGEGNVCALGAVGVHRGVALDNLDPEEPESVAQAFNIAEQLAREIVYINDEGGGSWRNDETPQARWERIRAWAIHHTQQSKWRARSERR